MTTLAKDIARVKELRDRPRPASPVNAGRCYAIAAQHAAGPESRFLCWQDVASDDAGVPRHGEI